MRNKKASWETR